MASSTRNKLKINVTSLENEFRINKYPSAQEITAVRLSCTVCGLDIKHRIVTTKNVHPLLEVLMCQKCNYFYSNRNLNASHPSRSSCAWCSKESKLMYSCDKCPAKFCHSCIDRNVRNYLPTVILSQTNGPKTWQCFICNSSPLWSKRAECYAAVTYNERVKKELEDRRTRIRASLTNTRTASSSNLLRASSVPSISPSSVPSVVGRLRASKDIASSQTSLVKCTKDEKSEDKISMTNLDEDRHLCIICLEGKACMVFNKCGHVCLCEECAAKITSSTGDSRRCPLCRQYIIESFKIYF